MGVWIRVGSEEQERNGLRMCWDEKGSQDLLINWM